MGDSYVTATHLALNSACCYTLGGKPPCLKKKKKKKKDFNESGINYRYARLVCRIHIARPVSPWTSLVAALTNDRGLD